MPQVVAVAWLRLPRHMYDWGSSAARSIGVSRLEVAGALVEWGFTCSPEPLRFGLFDVSLPGPAAR
ncbi:MAG TPA: hypothetical protein DFR83_16620 [Deltaproteobacteria bacterium]|nr:hypothetical protein [Deltaproteobacteria bacterium]